VRRLCGGISSCLPSVPSEGHGAAAAPGVQWHGDLWSCAAIRICACDFQSNISSFSSAALEHKIVKIQLGMESRMGEKVPRDCSE